MNALSSIPSFWRPRPAADTSIAWAEQLDELAKVESEIRDRITALELARGTVLISCSADEVAKAETTLAAARAELERIPVMRTEIIARRDKAAAREEITMIETEREQIRAEVAAVVTDIANFNAIVEPLLSLLGREKAIHLRVEQFNRRYREMAQRRNLNSRDVLSAPIDSYWEGKAPCPFPIWRVTKVPAADMKSWLWREERR